MVGKPDDSQNLIDLFRLLLADPGKQRFQERARTGQGKFQILEDR